MIFEIDMLRYLALIIEMIRLLSNHRKNWNFKEHGNRLQKILSFHENCRLYNIFRLLNSLSIWIFKPN